MDLHADRGGGGGDPAKPEREADFDVLAAGMLDDLVRRRYFVADAQGRITRWSAGGQALLGWSQEEVAGRSAFRRPLAWSGKGLKPWERYLDAPAGQRPPRSAGVTLLCRDGGELPVELTTVPVPLTLGFEFTMLVGDLAEGPLGSQTAARLLELHPAAIEAIAAALGDEHAPPESLAGLLVAFRKAGKRTEPGSQEAEHAARALRSVPGDLPEEQPAAIPETPPPPKTTPGSVDEATPASAGETAAAEAKLKEATAENEALRGELATIRGRLGETEDAWEEARAESERLAKMLEAAGAEARQAAREAYEADERRKRAEAQAQSSAEALEAAQRLADELTGELDEAKRASTLLETAREDASESSAKLGQLTTERDEARAALERGRREHADAVASLEQAVGERDQARSELEQTVAGLDEALASLEAAAREGDDALAAREQKAVAERDEARKELAQARRDLEAARAGQEQAADERDELRAEAEAVARERDQLKDELDASARRAATPKGEVGAQQELQGALDRALRERDEAAEAAEQSRARADEARAEVERLRADGKRAADALSEHELRAETRQQHVEEVERMADERVAAAESAHREMRHGRDRAVSRLREAEETLAAERARIADLRSRIAELESSHRAGVAAKTERAASTTPELPGRFRPPEAAAPKRARPGLDDVGEPRARIGLDGRFEELNAAFCALVGHSESEFRRASWPPLVDEAHRREELRELTARMVGGEIESAEISTVYMHANGLLVPIIGTVSLERDASGAPQRLVLDARSRSAATAS